MKLTRKHVVTGLAAAGLLAGAIAAGGVALASTGTAPVSAASAPAASSYGPGTGNCGGRYGMQAGQQPVMTAAADYLGLSLTQLRARLHSGTSLADIATAQGKPVSGLKNAILAAMTSRINANPALTAQEKAAMISQVKSHLDTMINMEMDMGHLPGMDMDMGMAMCARPKRARHRYGTRHPPLAAADVPRRKEDDNDVRVRQRNGRLGIRPDDDQHDPVLGGSDLRHRGAGPLYPPGLPAAR